jgi:hypothetical protein
MPSSHKPTPPPLPPSDYPELVSSNPNLFDFEVESAGFQLNNLHQQGVAYQGHYEERQVWRSEYNGLFTRLAEIEGRLVMESAPADSTRFHSGGKAAVGGVHSSTGDTEGQPTNQV